MVELGKNKKGFVIAGHKSDDGRLIVKANEPSDIDAAKELFDTSRRRWWWFDWSTDGRPLQPILNGTLVSDSTFILHILRRTANYVANERRYNVTYGTGLKYTLGLSGTANSCNAWIKTLFDVLGANVSDLDFFGWDLGHGYNLNPSLFEPPPGVPRTNEKSSMPPPTPVARGPEEDQVPPGGAANSWWR